MRVALTCALLAAFQVACAGASAPLPSVDHFERPKVRQTAPAFQLETLGGGALSLEDYAGHLVILNFWATWCLPCREEMPAMERLWQRHQEDGLAILGIAADRGNRAGVEEMVAEAGVSFPIPLDPTGDVRNRYEVSALPYTYFVDRDGRFLARVVGAVDWDSTELRAWVLEALGGDSE